jgi:hemoglobin
MTQEETAVTPFQALGGREGIGRLVEAFYAHVEGDALLRPVYPENLEPGKTHLKLYLEQWLGGEQRYSALFGHPRLRMRHLPFQVTPEGAGRWLRNMRLAMQDCGVDDAAARQVFEAMAPLARHMVNAQSERAAPG